MQMIKAGPEQIEVMSVSGEPVYFDGAMVDSLTISLPGDITEDQLTALTENAWELYDDNGTLNGVHTGCNQIMSYKVTFLKLTDSAKLQMQLQKAADEITEARKQAAEKAQQVAALQQDVAMLNNQIQAMIDLMAASGISIEVLKQSQAQQSVQAVQEGQ